MHENAKWNISDQDLLDLSVELWERMLWDLIAMNVDDLRNWEMAVAVTNIIDINHLKWVRGKVFSDSMWIALENVIWELDIAMTAWETAVLWEPKKVEQLLGVIDRMWGELRKVLDLDIWDDIKWQIRNILERAYSRMRVIEQELEFNIGWTGLWVIWSKNKLVDLEAWQAIVYLQEKPTNNWIIWPRSNWITAIRKHMANLAWEWWENLSFEEFLKIVWEDRLPTRLKEGCAGLQMWDIATWKTTVFNPFISRKLLWGLENDPIVDISSIIHVTWNPWRKISEWLRGKDNLWVDLHLEGVKLPQIIEILQILWQISDE